MLSGYESQPAPGCRTSKTATGGPSRWRGGESRFRGSSIRKIPSRLLQVGGNRQRQATARAVRRQPRRDFVAVGILDHDVTVLVLGTLNSLISRMSSNAVRMCSSHARNCRWSLPQFGDYPGKIRPVGLKSSAEARGTGLTDDLAIEHEGLHALFQKVPEPRADRKALGISGNIR